jgi:hypothetical protein
VAQPRSKRSRSFSAHGRTKADDDRENRASLIARPNAAYLPLGVALVRAASGRRDVELQALVQRVIVTDDPRGTAERARVPLPELSVDAILGTPYLWIGTIESICEGVLAARERWGFSYFTVFNHSIEAVTPIVNRLAGT